ncbi:unnamed protein product [Ectocarpus sp. 12 AP-2014]
MVSIAYMTLFVLVVRRLAGASNHCATCRLALYPQDPWRVATQHNTHYRPQIVDRARASLQHRPHTHGESTSTPPTYTHTRLYATSAINGLAPSRHFAIRCPGDGHRLPRAHPQAQTNGDCTEGAHARLTQHHIKPPPLYPHPSLFREGTNSTTNGQDTKQRAHPRPAREQGTSSLAVQGGQRKE